jgi:hypothetical protein
VREFAGAACSHAGLDYRRYVKPDPDLYRPAEVNLLSSRSARVPRRGNPMGVKITHSTSILAGPLIGA